MNQMILALILICLSLTAEAGPFHRCDTDAVGRAKALLLFHLNTQGIAVSESHVTVDEHATQMKSMKALRGRGRYDVLEVLGWVFKAQYRMHLIYAQLPPPTIRFPESCILVGQEVIDITDPN